MVHKDGILHMPDSPRRPLGETRLPDGQAADGTSPDTLVSIQPESEETRRFTPGLSVQGQPRTLRS